MIGRRVLVTGGTGVVGRPLVAALLAMGREVQVLSRTAPRNGDLLAHPVAPTCRAMSPNRVLALPRRPTGRWPNR